ncbi:inositol monophosphatase family protein [Marimonas arenosa]|uniref:Inositol monophosphatase n=1 Tax=Marimonas arenosa TaxID=1795305 RepID=A0AAE3WE13_9RHOB|nr:inositol monophosphatase [Marimonas arenosa]MDQ2091531.1 inositol monophosphatase [Marimonas arenosa]
MPPETLPLPAPRLTPAQETSLIQAVRRAARAEILPRFRNLAAGQISQKSGPQDLVTEADTAAEALIARSVLQHFPNAVVLGEEAYAADPSLRDSAASAELAIIVDPVDGTWNFAHGVPLFGVILAATRYGRPVFGLLYDPITDDWITASEDGPAWQSEIAAPSKRLATSAGGALSALSGIAHVPLMPQDHQEAFAPVIPAFARLNSLRCSCHEYRLMAQGAVDFVLSGVLNPWDHAAGAFIATRAGGVARFLDGRDYDISVTEGYLLTAANETTWLTVRDVIAPGLSRDTT